MSYEKDYSTLPLLMEKEKRKTVNPHHKTPHIEALPIRIEGNMCYLMPEEGLI